MYPYSLKPIEPEIVNPIAKDKSTLVVSVADAVQWNNQTTGVAAFQASFYTHLINTAREIVESYIWRDLTQCTYQAYYDLARYGIFNMFYSNLRLVMNRSPIFNINNIQLIEYLDSNGNWDTFAIGTADTAPGLYANVTERMEKNQWASLYFVNPPAWVDTLNTYKARITFNCGYDWSYSGTVNLSYNNSTGLVTCTTPAANLLNNNGMTCTISSVGQAAYSGTFAIKVISNTVFTYQLTPRLNLVPYTGNYVSTPNSLYTVPETIITAIKNIVAFNYARRGDESSSENIDGYPVPPGTRALLDSYNIGKTQLGTDMV